MLTAKRVELVPIECSVRQRLRWSLQRRCAACIVLLPLQNLLERLVAPSPCFGSLAMARSYLISCGCSAMLAFRVENFRKHISIPVVPGLS